MVDLARDSVANDGVASAPVHQSAPGNLPQEIWAQILRHVDDEFTLWVTCRQVSHVIRTEAEREFALTRLQKLKFHSSAECATSRRGHTCCYRCKISTKRFQCFLQDGQEVKYKIKEIGACLCDEDDNGEVTTAHYSGEHSNLKETGIGLLGYQYPSDNMGPFEYHFHRVDLGYYVNDAPLKYTSLDFDSLTLTFQWKPFLNDFFKNFSYVQKRTQVTTPIGCLAEQSLDQLFERIAADPQSESSELLNWNWDYGAEQDQYFKEAYVNRVCCMYPNSMGRIVSAYTPSAEKSEWSLLKTLAVSFRKLGRCNRTRRPDPKLRSKFADVSEFLPENIEWAIRMKIGPMVKTDRMYRNRKLLEDYQRKHNITK